MKRLAHSTKRHLHSAARHLWDHFVPHPGNNHQPHVLKHRVLFAYSVILVLLKVLAVVAPIALPSSSLYSSAINAQNIIDLTNQTRKNLGLPELKLNSKLSASALAKAEDMMEGQYFAHTSPAGATPWSFILNSGYRYSLAGENLAVHFTSAEDLQEGWLASPTHRANIVNPRYTEIGVGVVFGEFEGVASTLVAQHFGEPLAEVAAPAPAPVASTQVATPQPKPAPVQPSAPSGQVAAAESTPKPPPAPKPASQPVTNPEPVAEEPQPQTQPEVETVQVETQAEILPPLVYEASLKLKPETDGSYSIRLIVTGAASVTAQLAGEVKPLEREAQSDVWSGTIAPAREQFGQSGEVLSVAASGSTGLVTTKSLALVAPQAQTQQVYIFNEGSDKYATFLGFIKVHNLQDSVRQVYVYFIVFLVASLLVNIFVRIRIQHPKVINHTLAVVALAVFLFIV